MRNFRHAAWAAALGIGLGASGAQAQVTIIAVEGGQPAATGTLRFNFDDLTPGSSSPQTATSVTGGVSLTVQFSGNAGVVSSATATPPFLSGGNGNGFGAGGGNQALGANATPFLSSGATDEVRGSELTLILPALATYFGLLWGSIDDVDVLRLFNGGDLVGTVTGINLTASPDGDTGEDGTRYVNMTSVKPFNRVVFSSTGPAFEFDNVALAAVAVPAPAGLALFGLGLGLLGLARRRG
jgi:hypothetical protein